MVYLAWRSDPFGKVLCKVFGKLEKGKEWLDMINSLRIGSVYHEKDLLVRHDPDSCNKDMVKAYENFDYGYSWYLEKREVE